MRDFAPIPIEATGLLEPAVHAYHPEFVNVLMQDLKEFVPVKTKLYMDEMPYLRVGREPHTSTAVIPFWGVAPYAENVQRLKATVNALRRKENGHGPLVSDVVVVAPFIEGRSSHPTLVPQDEAEDHWFHPSTHRGKVFLPGEAIYVEMFSRDLRTMNVDGLVVGDLHDKQTFDLFKESVGRLWHITAIPTFARWVLEEMKRQEIVDAKIYAPDIGARPRSSFLSELTDLSVVQGEKYHPKHNVSRIKIHDGKELKGSTVFSVDELIDTFGTYLESLKGLKRLGVERVYGFSTAAKFTGPAIDRLREALDGGLIDKLIITNTLPTAAMGKIFGDRVEVLDIAPLFVDTMKAALGSDEALERIKDNLFDFSPSEVSTK